MTLNPTHVVPQFTMNDRMRKAREVTGLDQAQFAVELGVSRGTVSNVERGIVTPRKIVVKAWALAAGVPVTWLETGEAPSPSGDGASEKCTPRDSNPEPIDLQSVRAARLELAA